MKNAYIINSTDTTLNKTGMVHNSKIDVIYGKLRVPDWLKTCRVVTRVRVVTNSAHVQSKFRLP